VRKSSIAPGILFFVLALAVPALIIAQQNRSARRITPDRTVTGANSTSKVGPSTPAIKSDVAEALSVIQSNHIDGQKLNYNDVFKSSINVMLSVLDPHSNYLDQAEFAAFRT
jgi:C-terminal processing protease CtpA/Prc